MCVNTIGRIPFALARPGDTLVWENRQGLGFILARVIRLLKEPDWDLSNEIEGGWHTTPIVRPGIIVDAQFPRVKLTYVNDYLKKGRRCRAYRTFDSCPPPTDLEEFIDAHVGRPYDWRVYFYTTVAKLARPFIDFPRIIDLSYDCWEVEWNFLSKFHFEPIDNSNFDYNYPWLPDLLRCMGEIPCKQKGKSA